MKFISPPTKSPDLKYFNWHAVDNLQRDKEQSRALHEPRFRSAKLGIFLASVISAAVGVALLSRISGYGKKIRPGR